jgi:hypothetical protein
MTGTPQARKLGLKAGMRVTLAEAPAGWELADPPAGLLAADPDGADVIVAFFRAADEIPGRLPALARLVFPAGAVWALWPRRAAGHVSDITDNVLRGYALDLGLVDVKVAAVDADWSGLRLVWRTSNRKLPAKFSRDVGSGKLAFVRGAQGFSGEPRDEKETRVKYVMLIMDTPAEPKAGTPEYGAWYTEIGAWYEKWGATGKLDGGHQLQGTDSAKTIRGGAVTDGPFIETKEVLGGYSVIEADTIDEAVEVAGSWPGVDRGWITIEVRPVIEMG